jgi:hypothetical protein
MGWLRNRLNAGSKEWRDFKWGLVYGFGLAITVFVAVIIWMIFR